LLLNLKVKDIGGINSADMTFKRNFVVVTGESGTGKSSLVRAVELLSGRRAQTDFIRYGSQSSVIEAVFVNDPYSDKELTNEDNKKGITAVREIYRNGRSKSYLENKSCSLADLKSFMYPRFTIQSQFAQLGLLEPDKQLELVDSCGGEVLERTCSDVSFFFKKAYDCDRRARTMKARQRELQEKYQKAEEVINILYSVKPEHDSEGKWEKEISELQTALSQNRKKESLISFFKGNENTSGLLDSLEEYAPQLQDLVTSEKDKLKARSLSDSLIDKCNELMNLMEMNHSLHTTDELEHQIDETEKKMGMVRKAKRMARVETIDELYKYAEEAGKALQWIRESNSALSELETQGKNFRKKASEKAMVLRRLRKEAASILENRVNTQLQDLAMEHLSFNVNLTEMDKLREKGAEQVDFSLKTTEGFSGPVTKIASGGELSRLLLAIQLSLPGDQLPETVIFDEVEAGLGGRAAVLAGYKLKELSSRSQVILITHEASIAALADQHYVVYKLNENTVIYEPPWDERISELARMLSGDYSMEEARQHAEKLLSENSLSTTGKN